MIYWMGSYRAKAIYCNRKNVIYGSTVNKLSLKGGENMALLETLTVVLGIIYGYASPGKENRGALLRKGLIIGIVLAIILVVLGSFVGGALMVFSVVSGVVIFVEVVILTVLFIIGTWVGDWLEGRIKNRSTAAKVSH
jgi:hypothetical protein